MCSTEAFAGLINKHPTRARVADFFEILLISNSGYRDDRNLVLGTYITYREDSNLAKVQHNINSKALVAHIDRAV